MLYEKLKAYGRSEAYPFHMPGHKRNSELLHLGEPIEIDITEIDGFDYLHDAEDILKEAQGQAAALYGAEETHFLVNGSTSGLLAAIGACCNHRDQIMVARNCHKAVYNSIYLNELNSVYLYPEINCQFLVNEGICPQNVHKMWIKYPNIQGIVITSPTYEGIVSNIREIADIAHSHGVPLIVDEAHGAHFPFSEAFPESALTQGADIVIQSLHKTMPAMTQTALLHVQGDLVNRDRLHQMLEIYQTSSPSYVLMCSMDRCMEMMAAQGKILFDNYTNMLHDLRRWISTLSHIKMLTLEELNPAVSVAYDISKIVLSVRGTTMDGQALYTTLRTRYQLQPEMVLGDYVVLMTGPGDRPEGYERLKAALKTIDSTLESVGESVGSCDFLNRQPAIVGMSAYEALSQAYETRTLKACEGYISREYAYVYPPGIPVLVPGEVITLEVIKKIEDYQKSGLSVRGPVDKTLSGIRVLPKKSKGLKAWQLRV